MNSVEVTMLAVKMELSTRWFATTISLCLDKKSAPRIGKQVSANVNMPESFLQKPKSISAVDSPKVLIVLPLAAKSTRDDGVRLVVVEGGMIEMSAPVFY